MKLSQIRTDGGTQPRAELSQDMVQEYAEAMAGGALFPPVDVFYDGRTYWLADGFHRYHAAQKLGLSDLPATVHQGTQRDAVLFSVGANAAHGMRRTNEDKRRAVMRLLDDAEWAKWSNREIARQCFVDERTVRSLRPAVTAEVPQSDRIYTTKHGTQATMRTANIGQAPRAPEQPAYGTPQPERPTPTYGAPRDLGEFQQEAARIEQAAQPTPQERYDDAPEAKQAVTMVRRWQSEMDAAMTAAALGKLAPEARRFLARRMRAFADRINQVAEELEA